MLAGAAGWLEQRRIIISWRGVADARTGSTNYRWGASRLLLSWMVMLAALAGGLEFRPGGGIPRRRRCINWEASRKLRGRFRGAVSPSAGKAGQRGYKEYQLQLSLEPSAVQRQQESVLGWVCVVCVCGV